MRTLAMEIDDDLKVGYGKTRWYKADHDFMSSPAYSKRRDS